MATLKQRAAARKNIKKAVTAARNKRTIAHLPPQVRTDWARKEQPLRPVRSAGSKRTCRAQKLPETCRLDSGNAHGVQVYHRGLGANRLGRAMVKESGKHPDRPDGLSDTASIRRQHLDYKMKASE